MLIDDRTAIELGSTIITSTQGAYFLRVQTPLQVEERDANWLVKGTPYMDKPAGLQYCFTFFLFDKYSAKVVGLGNAGRAILTEEKKRYWHTIMSAADFDRVFGPRTQFDPGGEELAQALFFHAATYGGLINKPDHAIAYAKSAAQTDGRYAHIAQTPLRATLTGDTWSIEDAKHGKIIVTVARHDGLTVFVG